jgi:hypothetical protein
MRNEEPEKTEDLEENMEQGTRQGEKSRREGIGGPGAEEREGENKKEDCDEKEREDKEWERK